MRSHRFPLFTLLLLSILSCVKEKELNSNKNQELFVRIAEIKIDQNYLHEYFEILQEESEASVRLEEGVVCIFPMFEKEDSTRVRLLEIYASQDAYQAHLNTKHFLKYKISTLHMVEELNLIDMEMIDQSTSQLIFSKLKDK